MQPNKCYFIDPVINKNYKIPLMVVGQVVKIKCQDNEQRHKKSKVFAGNVIFVNNRCVIIEGENYKVDSRK